MDLRQCAFAVLVSLCVLNLVNPYIVRNHPCCQEPAENVSLALLIDAFEVYGHDPTDKLDHLAHYQIEMMKVKHAPDQYVINEHIHIATDHLGRFINLHIKELKVLLIALDDVIDNMLTMYDNHNAIKTERVATFNAAGGGAVPAEFYISQGITPKSQVLPIALDDVIDNMLTIYDNHNAIKTERVATFNAAGGAQWKIWCGGAVPAEFYISQGITPKSQVLPIALDDVIDNMLTMYDNHNAIKTERVATFNAAGGGAVPAEFYISQEFYCGKNVYLFVSELYSDIYNMGRGPAPYCKERGFHFLGFVHFMDDTKYYLEEDPSVVFQMDNYMHGLECQLDVCIFRFPFKKGLQHVRDVSTMPKAIVKCGTETYKLPPLTAAACLVTSGSFILDFNIQGIRFRHYDYMLFLPNGHYYYTKERQSPLVCDHHVCEWNNTNFFGGPFIPPGEPGWGLAPPPVFVERTTEYVRPPASERPPSHYDYENITYSLDGCWFMFPPNYGSIAGVSYLDPLTVNEYRYTCSGNTNLNKGLYWYPQWMGVPPHHPYPQAADMPISGGNGVYYPHLQQLTNEKI